MKVFISWSGILSQTVAEQFRNWLPSAIQAVKPYFTPADIEKGDRWATEISKELEACDVGVLFVTKENLSSAWLLYEAGALSKKLEKSRVCPVLIGIAPNELPSPLRQFQATEFIEKDFKKLFKTINLAASAELRLADAVVEQVFDMWWPKLREAVDSIVISHVPTQPAKPADAERKILEEILELSRLTASRSSRSTIAYAAVEQLCSSLLVAHNALQKDSDAAAALSSLKETLQPIEYLTRKTDANRAVTQLIPSYIELKNSTFLLDDDIPF